MDIQKAGIWKRISAWLFDKILLAIAAVGVAALLSLAFDYDGHLNRYHEIRGQVEETYGISFEITEEEYKSYDAEKKARYDAAYEALNQNTEAVKEYSLLVNFALLIVTFSLLAGYLILEFTVPLFLKHGRTFGKKIFGLAVMKQNLVKVSGPVLFVRTVLGKYAVETMIPVYIVLMTLFGRGNILLVILLFLVPLVNLIMVIATKNNCFLHDLLAMTVVCDYQSQRIFDTPEEVTAFITAEHEAMVAKSREENVFQ